MKARIHNLAYAAKGLFDSLYSQSIFCICAGYQHRNSVVHFDDTSNEEEWQKEVYLIARKLFEERAFDSVLDIGCGSAYKMTKYFQPQEVVGVEVLPTLDYIKKKYPSYTFLSMEELEDKMYDLVILSDVIEHVEDPGKFMTSVLRHCKSTIVISTPARELIKDNRPYGPPVNESHYREWSSSEFRCFVDQYCIIEKQFVSNQQQFTQVIIATPK